jgi:hypothetical protein
MPAGGVPVIYLGTFSKVMFPGLRPFNYPQVWPGELLRVQSR